MLKYGITQTFFIFAVALASEIIFEQPCSRYSFRIDHGLDGSIVYLPIIEEYTANILVGYGGGSPETIPVRLETSNSVTNFITI